MSPETADALWALAYLAVVVTVIGIIRWPDDEPEQVPTVRVEGPRFGSADLRDRNLETDPSRGRDL